MELSSFLLLDTDGLEVLVFAARRVDKRSAECAVEM